MTIHFGTPVKDFILFRMYDNDQPLYDIDAKQHIPEPRTQDFLVKKKPYHFTDRVSKVREL